MKTKPYTPPPAVPVESDTAFPVDLPCMMWIGENEPTGPIPLAVCLLKALELARADGATFAIRGEASMKTILTLRDKTVSGERSVVNVFMIQVAVADNFFKKLARPAPSAAPSGHEGATGRGAQGVAEKQLNGQRPPKKP